jgi:hypothetical protein
MRRYLLLVVLAAFAVAGCEGARNNTSWSKKDSDSKIVPPLNSDQPTTHEDSTAVDGSAASSEETH